MEPKPTLKWTVVGNTNSTFELSSPSHNDRRDPQIVIYRTMDRRYGWHLMENRYRDGQSTRIAYAEGNDGFWELIERGKQEWLARYANP